MAQVALFHLASKLQYVPITVGDWFTILCHDPHPNLLTSALPNVQSKNKTCCQRSARRVEAGDVTTVPLPHGSYHNTGKLKASLCAGHGRRTRHWFGGTLWQIDLRETAYQVHQEHFIQKHGSCTSALKLHIQLNTRKNTCLVAVLLSFFPLFRVESAVSTSCLLYTSPSPRD